MYDYLVVGAGLFGAVFAQQATKLERQCWLLTGVVTSVATPSQRISKALLCISMALISFIPRIKTCGNMSIVLLSSTVTQIPPWQITRVNYTTCPSI